jgi:16S rRNA (guanine527-N7)-methyltransferase
MTSEQLLKKGLGELGFSYSGEQVSAFMSYLSELRKWNRAYNLTALRTDKDIILKHFLDSILYLKALQIKASKMSLADVGTGAGFPGIPIRIMRPEIALTLIDPSRKKMAFLRHIIRILKLGNGIEILGRTIEALEKDYEKHFDYIVSRATFKIRDFLDKALPYVKENGCLVLSKGPGVYKELEETKAIAGRFNIKVMKMSLMGGYERNLLVVTRKNRRKTGSAVSR